jgi:phosphoglycerate dehydrogenase-like enzyme
MSTILLTNFYEEDAVRIAEGVCPEGFELVFLADATRQELLHKVALADYFLAGGRSKIDDELLAQAPRLKMVQRSGVGLDSLDLEALKKRNIPLYVNAGVNARSVAEHTLMLMLAVLRKVCVADAALREGKWQKHFLGLQTAELHGKAVGLVGVGQIGRYVAGLLSAFGAEVYYFDPMRLSSEEEQLFGLQYLSFEELLAEVDIVSLHCPLLLQTKGMMGAAQFALMKKGSFVVNTSRGGLIDEQSLVEALSSRHLAGAGLDVFQREPMDLEAAVLRCENAVLTPHIGGVTVDSIRAMMAMGFENIQAFEQGRLADIADKKICI